MASPFSLSRRDALRLSAAGVASGSCSGWIERLAAETASRSDRRRSCILLWMNGGPSQLDTFDMKPGHEHGGTFAEIGTAVPGIRICEHLPKMAAQLSELAIIRSMSTKEGDHARATQLAHTGYLPQGPLRFPTLGSLVAKELGELSAALPNFVSIAPFRALAPAAYASGFLGPQYAPLIVGETALGQQPEDGDETYGLQVSDLDAGVSSDRLGTRLQFVERLNERFLENRPGTPGTGHATAYGRAAVLMQSAAGQAFDLEQEPAALRAAYGLNRFGQGCLLARRLVERGVPFVEVTLGGGNDNGLGWDTHADNFDGVRNLCQRLDPAWSTLLEDLSSRGLLESTTVAWMGEFGRTPKINDNGGRDHFPQAWTTVLAGGGIRGGEVVGRTSDDGTTVEERPVSVPDFLATLCRALGIDPEHSNESGIGRPITIVDPEAEPIVEILA